MSFQRIFTLVALLLVVAFFIVAASRSQKTEPTAQQKAVVINNTESLEAVSAVRNGGEVYLALRNDYTKNVTAFAVSIGDFRFTEEFVYSEAADAGILPNTTYERRFPIPAGIQRDSSKPIKIQAVVLDGGTGDGNSAVVQDIRDERLGERIQIERTLRLLDNYLELPSSKTNASVGEMKSQIIARLESPEADSLVALKKLQPGQPSNLLPEQTKTGLGTAKEGVLRKLQDVEAAQNTREELLKVRQHYLRVLRRL